MYAHRGNALAEILTTYKRAERKQLASTRGELREARVSTPMPQTGHGSESLPERR